MKYTYNSKEDKGYIELTKYDKKDLESGEVLSKVLMTPNQERIRLTVKIDKLGG